MVLNLVLYVILGIVAGWEASVIMGTGGTKCTSMDIARTFWVHFGWFSGELFRSLWSNQI